MREFDFCVGDILDEIPNSLKDHGSVLINRNIYKAGYLIYRLIPREDTKKDNIYYIFRDLNVVPYPLLTRSGYQVIGVAFTLNDCKFLIEQHALMSNL